MLMELTVVPLTQGISLSPVLAEVIKLIDESGLTYKVTEFGTLVEGSWDDLIGLAKECHVVARRRSDRVLTFIRLDDYAGRADLLSTTISRVEQHLGRKVKR